MKKSKLIIFLIYCVSIGQACTAVEHNISGTDANKARAEESIILSVNEARQYDFNKFDGNWTGTFTIFSLNENNQKVVKQKFVAAGDSSWNDFALFVDFLNLYEIQPQHEIEGWVPNSGNLPMRVYTFEIYDGENSRTFSFQDPIDDIRDYWQAQNVLTFVTFVENDLHWRRLKNID